MVEYKPLCIVFKTVPNSSQTRTLFFYFGFFEYIAKRKKYIITEGKPEVA